MKIAIESLEQELRSPEPPPSETMAEETHFEDWSASRALTSIDEKILMARFFARHHFLVREGQSPEAPRETVASIILNHGTTPNSVLKETVQWIKDNKGSGPFFLTWYTPGHLIPTTLKEIRDQDRGLRTALKLFLFPGEVDEEIQSVLGRDAEIFAERLDRHFTYAFLSAYSFDLSAGEVYFYFARELRLQRACAMRFADHKFLFLDSSKFKSSGEKAYGVVDMLRTSYSVTLYTVASERDEWIIKRFESLSASILKEVPASSSADQSDLKTLRLQVVGRDGSSTKCIEKVGSLAPRGRH
jgi:hypothetical protein